MRKKRCMICDHASGSSCSASSLEPFTSTKRTVTCLRSPSIVHHSFAGVRMGAPLAFSSTTTNLAGSVLLALRPTT